jgi:predicted nucleic acid-binding protein
MTNIFIDTSVDPEDDNYETASGFFKEIRENSPYRLYTTNLVFYETVTLIRSRIGIAESIRFGQSLFRSKGIQTIFVDHALEEKAFEIFTTHTDKDYSFIDCASFAVMEELGLQNAFTFDKHFAQAKFKQVP